MRTVGSRIRTTCPTCATVWLEVDDVTLVWNQVSGERWYAFDCTGCVQRVVKAAPPAVAAALSMADTPLLVVPLEVCEHPPTHRPLVVDDLLDAMLLLEQADDVSRLASEASPVGP